MNMVDMKEERNFWILMFFIVILGFISLTIVQWYWVIPSLMDNICHAYGYGKAVSWAFETYGYDIASLRCQGKLTVFKVV